MALLDGKFIEDGTIAAAKVASDVLTSSLYDAANGIPQLDGSGLIKAAQLPSYVDDVLEFADLASFPGTGETGKIYVALDTNKTYRWSGSVYVEISASEVDSVNGATGVVVLDSDDISEGVSNLYYTEARFDSSLSGKSTTDLSEGTNLYFTEKRVQDTILDEYVVGANTAIANTDAIDEAFGKVQGQINALASASTSAENEVLTLNATDISNGYKELSNLATTVLSVTPVGGLKQEPTVDYTLSAPVTNTRITFAGDLATLLADGDKLMVSYLY